MGGRQSLIASCADELAHGREGIVEPVFSNRPADAAPRPRDPTNSARKVWKPKKIPCARGRPLGDAFAGALIPFRQAAVGKWISEPIEPRASKVGQALAIGFITFLVIVSVWELLAIRL
jgi:hypothetical protein